MRQTLHRAVLAAALGAGMAGQVGAQADDQHHHMSGMPTLAGGSTPLYRDLGSMHRTRSRQGPPQAQQYFDQGLRLTYAFNHDEAIGSYTEGDPSRLHLRHVLVGDRLRDGTEHQRAHGHGGVPPGLRRDPAGAVALKAGATPVERDLIDAMAKRYGPEPVANRAPLDSAYAHALAPLAKKYPNDPDVQTLYTESLMDLSPWNYWTDRGTKPRPDTKAMVAALEKTIAKYPNHPGACHFYIHAVEASTTPERALPCANRLAELMPGAGHLVHMPSHIYMRTGQYDLVVEHNHHAVAEDETFIQDRRPTGFYQYSYYPHNYHMLWAGLIQLGRGSEAIAASRKIVSVIPIKVVETVPPLEYFFPTPYWSLVRFGKYDEMLAEPAPARRAQVHHRDVALRARTRGRGDREAGPRQGRAGYARRDHRGDTQGCAGGDQLAEAPPDRGAGAPRRAGGAGPRGYHGRNRGLQGRDRGGGLPALRRASSPGTTRCARSSAPCISPRGTQPMRSARTARTWSSSRTTAGRCTAWPRR